MSKLKKKVDLSSEKAIQKEFGKVISAGIELVEAKKDLKGTDGKISIRVGEIRDGGSYIKRFSNIAIWNTVMNNYDYTLEKWYEFLNS